MVKVTVMQVLQPNLFIGSDVTLFSAASRACDLLSSSGCLLMPACEILPGLTFLTDIRGTLSRVRVLSVVSHSVFRCFLIDVGRTEEIGKHKLFIIPPNQLQMDPAVKLFKITGIVPVGMNLSNKGVHITAELSESERWIGASYKFVCQLFEENNCNIHVSYVKECTKDKAHVDVFLYYKNQRESLKDILVREKMAMEKEEHLSKDIPGGLSSLSLVEEEVDKMADDSSDSLAGESITKYLDDVKDDDETTSLVPRDINHVDNLMESDINLDSLTTNRLTFDTLDELAPQILNIKVKSWLISKTVQINDSDETVIKYEYKKPDRPILSYQKDPKLAAFLKNTMVFHKTKSLLLIQAPMIPTILRGINVVAIAPPKKGKSMGMLMPILQKIATKPLSKTRSFNPLAIILCTSWKKVQVLFDSSKIFIGFINESKDIRKPRVVPAYAGQREKKIMIPILEGCDLLIITPKCLLRLLKTHEFFKLNELEILGLDDAENLIAHHLDVLKEIFIYKHTGVIESGKEVQQIVTASNWTSGLQSFVQNEMGTMFMLTVDDPLEIAVFERLKQKIIECDKTPMDLYEKLLTYLEMKESTIKRTVIFANDDVQVRAIYKFLMQKVTFDLKLMLGSMSSSELSQIEKEWNQYRGYVNMPVLLISDEALGRSDISIFNAQTIFHVDINPITFAYRLNFLRDKFSELSFLQQPSTVSEPCIYHSYIFICMASFHLTQANFLYKFLGRCYSERPTWLQEKAIDYVLNKEKSKVINEICHRIKAIGECRFPACTKRHIVLSDTDKPLLPNRGKIKFRLLHLVSPSNFFVRILEQSLPNETQPYKSQYTSLQLSLIKYFGNSKNIQGANPKYIQPGFLAGMRVKDRVERVLVLKMKRNNSTKLEVKLVDVGSTMIAEQADLLALPKDLCDVPPQAVEVFVTGIRPLDNDEHYHDESVTAARSFLEEKDLYAVVMLCIGKTLWIDSVTQLIHHKATNISVYDNNLSVELIEKDFVEKNPGHIQKLIRLCTGKIDIWNSASEPESSKPVPIMRKFTYEDEPLKFEELSIQYEDDYTDDECTVLKILSPKVIFLSNRDTKESIKHMQKEIQSLIESIESIPLKSVHPGSRVLFCHDSDDWRRGYVLKRNENSVLLYALDWGTVATYIPTPGHCELKRLPSEYQELPYHAILTGLRHLSPNQPFSEDATTVIHNFVHYANDRKVSLAVSAFSSESIQDLGTIFELDSVDACFQDLDLVGSMKWFSVSISKKVDRNQEELLDVLVRKLCVIPAHSWIYTVLPESEPFISRLERSGSIPHMGFDIFCTTDVEKRLKISANIERLISKNIAFFQSNEVVPSSVDAILNTMLVLLHFVNEQPVFMCYYRSLTALLNLAYKNKLPLNNPKSEQEFSISYISNVIYSYQAAMFHILSHLSITVRMKRMDDESTFLEMLKLLLIDTCFVNNVFEQDSWVMVMATCVGSMQDDDKMYNELMDILVQLAMLSQNQSPFLAGVLKQCCLAVQSTESPSVWNSSLAFIGCLINCKVYHSLFRDLDFFNHLFNKMEAYLGDTKCWTEMQEVSLEMLTDMWRNGSVDRRLVVQSRTLSDRIRELNKLVPGNERLAKLLTDVLLEESSITAPRLNDDNELNEKSVPDMDAHDWMMIKDGGMLKKHKKSYRKIFQEDQENGQESGDEKGSVESDSDSSDAEVTSFFKSQNPADEDNVLCYDRP